MPKFLAVLRGPARMLGNAMFSYGFSASQSRITEPSSRCETDIVAMWECRAPNPGRSVMRLEPDYSITEVHWEGSFTTDPRYGYDTPRGHVEVVCGEHEGRTEGTYRLIAGQQHVTWQAFCASDYDRPNGWMNYRELAHQYGTLFLSNSP